MGARTELTRTCRGRLIARGDYSKTAKEFGEEINNTPTEKVNQERIPLTAEKEMNQSRVQVADYEQELYEKDQYIQALENEIRGLKGSIYCLREKIL